MTQPKPTKPGNVQITKVGHTISSKFGQSPTMKAKGDESITPISFGKGA